MKVVSGDCDYNSLYLLLENCQNLSIDKTKQSQIISISTQIKDLDPLSVLRILLKEQEISFYFEHPVSGLAIAGAGVVVGASFDCPERFMLVRDFAKGILENVVAVGDLNLHFSGPHFFTSFTFDDFSSKTNIFPAAQVLLPRCQVVRNGLGCLVVVNISVTPESDISSLAEEVCAIRDNLNDFDCLKDISKGENTIRGAIELGGSGWYEKAVQTAKFHIDGGACGKIVIARALDTESVVPISPLATVNCLRTVYPQCFSFFMSNGEGQSFISASPERLLKIEKGRAKTEALAGSISRGISEEEDDCLGELLLKSGKDLREHRFVVDSIVAQLQSLGITPEFKNGPELKRLSNIQHLCTPIEGDMPRDLHLLDVAAILHPTPAVCGVPSGTARRIIAEIENFERGLYAGTMGWFDHRGDGELIVGIRSALIDGHKARLYAGSGIVKDSDLDNERTETDIKLQAILKNLR